MGNSTSQLDGFQGPLYNTTVTDIQQDYVSSFIIAWTVFGLQCVWSIVCLSLLFWRRNATYTRQRSPLLLSLEHISQSLYVLINCVRIGIGRSKFPCFIYSAEWFWIEAAFGLPIALRGLRLFIVYRISHNKSMSSALQQVSRRREMRKRSRSGAEPGGSPDGEEGAATSSAADGSSTMATNATSVAIVTDAPLESIVSEPGSVTTQPVEDLEANEAKQRLLLRRSMRKLKALQCLVSNPCILIVMALVYVLHAALWLLTIGLINPTQYFTNGFALGCALGQYKAVYVVVILQIVVYIVVIAVVVLLLFFVRDTWQMRFELAAVLLVVVLGVGLYLVALFIPVINDWSDYFVPVFFLLLIAIWGDNFVSIIVPTVISVVRERRERRDHAGTGLAGKKDQLHFVLHNKALKDAFRTFSTRSFAVESLLAWDAVREYRKAKTVARRHALGRVLISKFTQDGSPLELNLTAKLKREKWLERLENSNAAVDVFDALRQHAEVDMLDTLSRFANTAQYRKLVDAARQEVELKEKTSALM